MGIYIFIFLVLLMVSLASVFVKINKYYSIYILLALILFGALRYEIGMDYKSYEEIFDTIGSTPRFFDDLDGIFVEPGYAIIISWLKYLGVDNVGLFALHMTLSVIITYLAILKYSRNVFISWLIMFGVYYANLFFNGIRQGLFIAIILYILPDLLNKGLKGFIKVLIISVLLTIFLHKTAIILPVLFLVCLLNFSIQRKIIILVLSIIWAFIGIGDVIIQVAGLSFFKESSFLSVVDLYTQHESFSAEIKFFSISVMHRLVILALALYFAKKNSAEPIFIQLANIYYWGIVFYFFLAPLGYLLTTRISMNLKIFDTIIIAYFIPFLQERSFKVAGVILIAIWSFSVMLTNFYIPGNYKFYVPYRSIFNK
jgi:hypothetical protein